VWDIFKLTPGNLHVRHHLAPSPKFAPASAATILAGGSTEAQKLGGARRIKFRSFGREVTSLALTGRKRETSAQLRRWH